MKNRKVLSHALTWARFHQLKQSVVEAMEGCGRSSAISWMLLRAEGWPEPMCDQRAKLIISIFTANTFQVVLVFQVSSFSGQLTPFLESQAKLCHLYWLGKWCKKFTCFPSVLRRVFPRATLSFKSKKPSRTQSYQKRILICKYYPLEHNPPNLHL